MQYERGRRGRLRGVLVVLVVGRCGYGGNGEWNDDDLERWDGLLRLEICERGATRGWRVMMETV